MRESFGRLLTSLSVISFPETAKWTNPADEYVSPQNFIEGASLSVRFPRIIRVGVTAKI